jgi:hypothetical protein
MQRRTVLALLSSSLLLGCSRSSSQQSPPPAKHSSADLSKLTVNQVEERINGSDGKLAIYDCNSKEQYGAAHLPGARWVESHSVTAAVLPQDKTATLIFYCYNEA